MLRESGEGRGRRRRWVEVDRQGWDLCAVLSRKCLLQGNDNEAAPENQLV
jgi:hypothetical protein